MKLIQDYCPVPRHKLPAVSSVVCREPISQAWREAANLASKDLESGLEPFVPADESGLVRQRVFLQDPIRA